MENRRRFPRFDSTFQVKYLPAGKNMPLGYTISNNISRGGLCMPTSSGIINKGDIVKLDMENKDGKSYIPATGKVKWLKKVAPSAPLEEEAGIEFTDINSASIEEFLKENKGH